MRGSAQCQRLLGAPGLYMCTSCHAEVTACMLLKSIESCVTVLLQETGSSRALTQHILSCKSRAQSSLHQLVRCSLTRLHLLPPFTLLIRCICTASAVSSPSWVSQECCPPSGGLPIAVMQPHVGPGWSSESLQVLDGMLAGAV